MATISQNTKKFVLAFDVYGTILSTSSISVELSAIYGKDAGPKIAEQWRRYQLEYTWRLNSMQMYEPFHHVTACALRHAVFETGCQVSSEQSRSLMKKYDELFCFEDVKPGLDFLRETSEHKAIEAVLFSNGTSAMIDKSISGSSSIGEYKSLFRKTVCVDDMPSESRAYKPAPQTYQYLSEKVGTTASNIWLITSNPFDIVGANASGLNTAWVDRSGVGWVDQLSVMVADPHTACPDVIGTRISDIIDEIMKRA